MNPLAGLVTAAALLVATSLDQQAERTQKYNQGLAYSRAAGKPLLVVGTPGRYFRAHPCGSVTLDLNPMVLRQCPQGGEVADVRAIPYPPSYFGAAFVSHVMEHLPSVEDAILAWGELHRVADQVLVAGPSPLNLIARLVPDHCLWAWQIPDGSLYIQHRELWNPSMPNSWFSEHALREAVVGPDLSLRSATPRHTQGQQVV